MGRFDDITMEELQELREQTEGGVPQERVLAAIGRKQGDQIDTLAERHGVVERTIIYWLDRFEEEPIEQAPYDEPRPGRPSKLDDDEREQLFEDLQNPPTELGYEQQAGHLNCCSRTSKTSTMSNTVRDTLASCWLRPSCPAGQHGRVTTKRIPR